MAVPTPADNVLETTATTGTGTYDLDGAVTGSQGFVAGVGTGNATFYGVTNGVDWEVGIGTVTDAAPDTLSRDAILASSNSGSAVSWGSGEKSIYTVNPASYIQKHKCGVRRAAAQSIPSSTFTKVQFDTEDFDVGGNFDSATNFRFTAPRDGRYFIAGSWETDFLADQERMITAIYINGTIDHRCTVANSGTFQLCACASCTKALSKDDYVEMFIWHNEGVAQNTKTGIDQQPKLMVLEL